MDKKKQALANFNKGYNCAQATISVFADDMGLTQDQVFRLLEGFGGGVGGMREVCGTLSAATAVIGYLNSAGDNQTKSKTDTYKKVREAAKVLEDKYGSVRCGDILNSPNHTGCSEVVVEMVGAVEDYLAQN